MKKIIIQFLLIITILFSFSSVYATQIKQMNDLSNNELIEYGRQLEKEEQEKEDKRQELQDDANEKFNTLLQQEEQEKIYNYIVPILFIILITIIIILLIKLHIQNKGNEK